MAPLSPKIPPFSFRRRHKSLILPLSLLLVLVTTSGVGEEENGENELFVNILRDEAVDRIKELGKISDAGNYLERTFLSPASIRASELIQKWMQDAGLRTWVDQMGNVHGRFDAMNSTPEALLIGSHLDTVIDAGMYDGSLGVISGISALKVLKISGKLEKLHRPVEVTATGSQGHAGTVPMFMRRDPMAASAELIVSLETICKHPESSLSYDGHCGSFTKESFEGLVCTVGEISSWPSASNVIPGQVNFTVDIRAVDDFLRESILLEFSNMVNRLCEQRMVSCTIERKHDAAAAHSDSELSDQLMRAAHSAVRKIATEIQGDVPVLMSGAGHDAMAMSKLTKMGMVFVRCRGGVSHSPEEYVLDDDVWAAGLTLLQFLETTILEQ